ncbi:MAG TPA: hypothetical protein VJ756_17855 [Terriglobales bacterium]|jgi:ElaB/YqjD/DUF883 family membrane-anchored ribosome-binding protein|nr:hypothetical protein [Terriglobales bacterium]
MAETRRSEQTLPPNIPALEPERELPAATTRSNPRLNEAAEAIGSALGSATRQVQNARDRFTVIRGGGMPGGPSTTEQIKQTAQDKMQAAQEKVEEIKERAGAVVGEARSRATAALEDARLKASRMAQDAKDLAVERARLVRLRATRFSHERPLAVIGAIGGAAFLLGVFLRLGRGKRG